MKEVRKKNIICFFPNTKIKKEQNKVKKLEQNFYAKLSNLDKQTSQFRGTIQELIDSPHLKIDKSLLHDIEKAKENAELEYNKLKADLNAVELERRKQSKNEKYLQNELDIKSNLIYDIANKNMKKLSQQKQKYSQILNENKKLLKKVADLIETNKKSELNWKIAEENKNTRDSINKKLQDLIRNKEIQIENLETENATLTQAMASMKEKHVNEGCDFKKKVEEFERNIQEYKKQLQIADIKIKLLTKEGVQQNSETTENKTRNVEVQKNQEQQTPDSQSSSTKSYKLLMDSCTINDILQMF